MHEENGRFLWKANPRKITFSNDVLAIDQHPIIRKTKGQFVINGENGLSGACENSTVALLTRNRLEAIVQLLNEAGKPKRSSLRA